MGSTRDYPPFTTATVRSTTSPLRGEGVYNFTAITQLVGLVDWMTNADDQWNRNHRNAY